MQDLIGCFILVGAQRDTTHKVFALNHSASNGIKLRDQITR